MPTTLQNLNIQFNDSSTQGTAWTGYRAQIFTGNGTFTIPAGVTALRITVVGGGGGGSYQGGGGGGTAIKYLTGLTPGNTLSVTVGGAGAAAVVNNTGGTGGSSTVASGTQTITTITGGGGSGGAGNYTFTTGASGGAATNGDLNIVGGNGGYGNIWVVNCVGFYSLGPGGASLFSAINGSMVGLTSGTTAPISSGYGGGGGASNTITNRAGVAGVVIFEW